MFWTGLAVIIVVYMAYDLCSNWVPGPFKYPILGNLPQMVKNMDRLADWFLDWLRKTQSRTVEFKIGNQFLTVTTDKRNVEHMLKTNWTNYRNSSGLRGLCMKDLLGRGIFAADGEEWQEQRKTASREFSANRFRTFMGVEFVHYATKLCSVVADWAKKGTPCDMYSLFFQLTMDAFGRIAFGVDLGCLEGKSPAFCAAFDNAQERVLVRIASSVYPLWASQRYLNIGPEAKLSAWIATCNTFLEGLIKERRVKKAQGLLTEEVDLLSRLMDVSDTEESKDDAYLRDMTMNFIVAGRDTTACALSWLFYQLSMNPAVEKRLREEIQSELCGAAPNFDNIKNCHYLQACMSETQRLHPSVPLDGKGAAADDVLPSGHRIRKGQTLTYANYCMGRDAEYWGPDPEAFRPARWLDKEGVYQKADPFLFAAFQAGPRLCLGIDMAHLEMKITTIMLLQKFAFAIFPGQDITYRVSLVLQMKNPMMMTVKALA